MKTPDQKPPSTPANRAGTVFRPQLIAKDSVMAQAAVLSLDAGLSDHRAGRLLLRSRTVEALERSAGNVCQAAKLLDVHRNTVTKRLEELELSRLPGEIRRQKRSQLALHFPKLQSRRAQPAPAARFERRRVS